MHQLIPFFAYYSNANIFALADVLIESLSYIVLGTLLAARSDFGRKGANKKHGSPRSKANHASITECWVLYLPVKGRGICLMQGGPRDPERKGRPSETPALLS